MAVVSQLQGLQAELAESQLKVSASLSWQEGIPPPRDNRMSALPKAHIADRLLHSMSRIYI
jgi:hypothetical protein